MHQSSVDFSPGVGSPFIDEFFRNDKELRQVFLGFALFSCIPVKFDRPATLDRPVIGATTIGKSLVSVFFPACFLKN